MSQPILESNSKFSLTNHMMHFSRNLLSENYLTFDFQNKFINYNTFQKAVNFSRQIM